MNELERALTALGPEIAVPEAPDLVPAVLARIQPRRERPQPRRWVLAFALVVLAMLGATLSIPDARSALFRILHIGGERIEFVDDLPAVPPAPEALDLELALGERVSMQEARSRAAFDLRELDDAPDRVYVGERGTVWFLYGTPERVRLLVAQTPLVFLDETLFLKKLAGPDTRVEQVVVDGSTGYLLAGEPHLVLLLDANGEVIEESARLARDVLVWESGGVAYRLEGDFGKDDALRLARMLE